MNFHAETPKTNKNETTDQKISEFKLLRDTIFEELEKLQDAGIILESVRDDYMADGIANELAKREAGVDLKNYNAYHILIFGTPIEGIEFDTPDNKIVDFLTELLAKLQTANRDGKLELNF